ncbi:HSP90 family protein, partial [Streptomyces sp. 2RAF24]
MAAPVGFFSGSSSAGTRSIAHHGTDRRRAGRGHRLVTSEPGRLGWPLFRSSPAITGRRDRLTRAVARPPTGAATMTADQTPHTFQVDLRGLVDLLSHHLYSSPRVYLRELLQNAVDALTARRALDPRAPARV